MTCVLPRLWPAMTLHLSYNILSIRLQNCVPQTPVVVVSRPPDVTAEQSIALFSDLYKSIDSSCCSVVTGDFNIIRDWSMPIVPRSDCVSGELSNFILDNDFIQLNILPSRGEQILDLVLVSSFLSNSDVCQLLPVSITWHKGCVALYAPA